ncbi:phage tail protein, partial [Escherichia coli]|nr:phage tail protein [Escherichia coli]
MGKRLGAADVDKWALYAIGQYCDQTVPDGFGGTEPRMTFNAYLSQQRKAWDVLSDFCSAMRCMPVWNGQTLTFVQDRPSDKVWTYNRSNVVMPDDGAPFRYSFSALKDRHNAVEVNWTDLHRSMTVLQGAETVAESHTFIVSHHITVCVGPHHI